jgi:hypothetical protein
MSKRCLKLSFKITIKIWANAIFNKLCKFLSLNFCRHFKYKQDNSVSLNMKKAIIANNTNI